MKGIHKNKVLNVLVALLPIQWIGFKIMLRFNQFIENFYSNGLYKHLSSFLKTIFGWIPFSLGQLLFYLILGWFLYIFYSAIRNIKNLNFRNPKSIFLYLRKPLAFLSVMYFAFMVLWGLNYGRNSLYENLQFAQVEINIDNLTATAKKLVQNTNTSRKLAGISNDTCLVLDWKNREYFNKAAEAYQNLEVSHPLLGNTKPSVKSVAFPQLMSLFGLGGIYFPFTGEANVNMHQPDFKLPFTICHEMAHQIGIGSETEANFIAYLACNQSDDNIFKYSGNFAALRYVLNTIHRTDTTTFNELIVTLDKGVLLDLEANTLYWERFETPLEDVSRLINNLFLKANGESDGVKSYGKMVELLVAFEEWKAIMKKKPIITKPKVEESKTQESPQVNLPFSYSCFNLKNEILDSAKLIEDRYFVLYEIAESNSNIVFDGKNLEYLYILITDGHVAKKGRLCFDNQFGKIVIAEHGIINLDQSISITINLLDCTKISDSLTVCDTIKTQATNSLEMLNN